MNTAQLKKRHPEVYREFFNRYDLVISCPILDDIIGALSWHGESGSIISWRAPLRNYIGINIGSRCGKRIPYVYLENAASDFKRGYFDKYYRLDGDDLSSAGLDFQLGILSEYNWTDHPGIFLLIGIAEGLARGSISPEEIKVNVNEKRVVELVGRIERILSRLHPFLRHFAYFGHYKFIPGILCGSNSFIHQIDRGAIGDLGQEVTHGDLDLSVFVINPNRERQSPFHVPSIQERDKEITIYAGSVGINYNRDLTEGIGQVDRYFSLQALRDLNGLEKNATGRIPFFENLNSYHQIIYGAFQNTGTELSEANRFTEIFSHACKKTDQNFSMFTARMCQIFSTRNISLDQTTIAEINKKLGTNFTLDYSSHEDGWETEGVKLEQWRTKGIYSEFTSPYAVTVAIDGLRTESPAEYEEALEKHSDGVVLDLEEKRIFVGGKPVTSKELKSQAATIDLLERLTKSDRGEISSKDLPASAYSKDRSEMSSKILSPLRKIVEKRLGKDFPIETRGSSNGGFSVRLEKCGVAIAAVKKR